MLKVDITIVDSYFDELISGVKKLIRYDINKSFTISVSYSSKDAFMSVEIPQLRDYNKCSDFISYILKFMEEKAINGSISKVDFVC